MELSNISGDTPAPRVQHDFQADLDTIARMESVSAILEIVCRVTGMGFAAVARVTSDRWIACRVLDRISFGLTPGGELPVETTICNEIRQTGSAVTIDHVAEDPAFKNHPTPALYGFQSYISVPIVLGNGGVFGTLCAIDPHPHAVSTPQVTAMFEGFAGLIAAHIDDSVRLAASELDLQTAVAALSDERKTSELREQFVAILGHDLRNSVAAIGAGASLLQRTALDTRATAIVALLQSSVARMGALITNTLDFARTRLGSGIQLDLRAGVLLTPVLIHVVNELKITHQGRVIETAFSFADPVRCDPERIGQMVSNLVGNALSHGAEDVPVMIAARDVDGAFQLEVTNGGAPIPADKMERLFEPFYRGGETPDAQGLGLGLYIAREIARAHSGTLDVTSTPEATRLVFRMPRA